LLWQICSGSIWVVSYSLSGFETSNVNIQNWITCVEIFKKLLSNYMILLPPSILLKFLCLLQPWIYLC
jgi:hypothetical protein